MERMRQHDQIDLADLELPEERDGAGVGRRRFLAGLGAGAVALGARVALGADAMGPVAPPSTVSAPPRDFGPNGAPNVYLWS